MLLCLLVLASDFLMLYGNQILTTGVNDGILALDNLKVFVYIVVFRFIVGDDDSMIFRVDHNMII